MSTKPSPERAVAYGAYDRSPQRGDVSWGNDERGACPSRGNLSHVTDL